MSPTLACSAASRRRLCSSPLLHSLVGGWRPLRDRRDTKIWNLGHQGWDWLPSYRITSVSHTCLCKKLTRSFVLISACYRHPSTGHQIMSSIFREETRSWWASFGGRGGGAPPCPPCPMMCWVWGTSEMTPRLDLPQTPDIEPDASANRDTSAPPPIIRHMYAST